MYLTTTTSVLLPKKNTNISSSSNCSHGDSISNKETNNIAVKRVKKVYNDDEEEECKHNNQEMQQEKQNLEKRLLLLISSIRREITKNHANFLYTIVSLLCIMMVFWILLIPGTWLIGRSKLHDEFLIPMMKSSKMNVVSLDAVLIKYAGHTLIQCTHVLPAAIWAAIIPFQLHPKFRSEPKYKKYHKPLGYLFLLVALTMSCGVVIILQREMSFEHFFDDLKEMDKKNNYQSSEPLLYAMTIWFDISLLVSIYYARSKKNKLHHQRWMNRHIASGIWVALQRVLLVSVYPMIYSALGLMPLSRYHQRRVFGEAAWIAMVLCMCSAEYMNYRLLRRQKQKRY